MKKSGLKGDCKHPILEALTAASQSGGGSDLFDVLRQEIGDFQVGIARYRLRVPLLVSFYPRLDGLEGRLTITPATLPIVGSGTGFDEAWRDWTEKFHVRFQTLLAMRPWEMESAQNVEWEQFEQMVDVETYRRETPYIIREIGLLTCRRPIPNQIRWEDGRAERVELEQMPPEFASLLEGQRFEAEVMREFLTDRLIRVVVVHRLPPLRITAADEALWATLPTTKDATSVDWDEFE